jgi:hypothetical protein
VREKMTRGREDLSKGYRARRWRRRRWARALLGCSGQGGKKRRGEGELRAGLGKKEERGGRLGLLMG